MPKIINHEQRKLDLLRATISACYDLGFSRTNIGTIATNLGFSRTLFYSYFPDKSSMVDFALDYVIDVIGRDYQRLCENAFLSSTEKIYRLFEQLLTDIVRERRMMSIFIDILLDRNREMARQRRRIYRWMFSLRTYLLKILRSGITRKELLPVQAKPMANTLLTLLISTIYAFTMSRTPAGSQIMRSVAVLLQGLASSDCTRETT